MTSETKRGAVFSLTRLDKAAVATTAAASAFNVLLWSVGATLHSAEWWLPAARWLFGGVSFVSFDLVVLAVVADQRAHGRRWLGTVTATGAALLSGGVALHVAGVIDAPALHAGPAALLLLLALHLSDTRGAPTPPPPDSGVTVTESVTLSRTARVKQIAAHLGVSESTAWRKVKAGEVEV